jgi:hypothetical protein
MVEVVEAVPFSRSLGGWLQPAAEQRLAQPCLRAHLEQQPVPEAQLLWRSLASL